MYLYCCTLCGEVLEKAEQLQLHITEQHKDESHLRSASTPLNFDQSNDDKFSDSQSEKDSFSSDQSEHDSEEETEAGCSSSNTVIDEYSLFSSDNLLTEYLNTSSHSIQSPVVVVSCPLCAVDLASQASLVSHLHEKHNFHKMSQHSNGNIMRQGRHWKKLQPSSFLCADCGLMLTSAKECKEHIVEYHLAPSQNSNRLMSQSRDSSDQLASTNDVKECARYIQLEQPFTGENHFQQHINAGLVAAEEQLPPVFALLCTICNEKLPDKTSLLFHMSSSHNKKLMYECSMCLKMFSHRLDLRRHLDTHRPQVQSLADNNLSCPFCPKQFRFQCTYDRHVATHTGVKFYVCKICFEEFRSQGCLVTHMSEHTGQSNWVCQKCGKNFAYQSYLERHLKTHITSPMTCPHCNDLFLIKAELEAHILKEHMDGGHIKCPQCDKTFLYTCYLERHLVTHTNSRDHFCPVCGKTFSLRNHVLSHLKTHLPAEKMSPVEEAASKKKYQCRLCPTPKFYRFESRLQRHLREVHAHTSKVICITSAGNMTIPEVVIN